eukprot:78109-Rhodomonas_salina.1
MRGTEIAYGATGSKGLAATGASAICLRACCAMPGTHIAYGGTDLGGFREDAGEWAQVRYRLRVRCAVRGTAIARGPVGLRCWSARCGTAYGGSVLEHGRKPAYGGGEEEGRTRGVGARWRAPLLLPSERMVVTVSV